VAASDAEANGAVEITDCVFSGVWNRSSVGKLERNGFCPRFTLETDRFTKTGSGLMYGKTRRTPHRLCRAAPANGIKPVRKRLVRTPHTTCHCVHSIESVCAVWCSMHTLIRQDCFDLHEMLYAGG
jgi:hypothetical protein